MTALAALASIATLVTFLFNWQTENNSSEFSAFLTLGIIGLCLFYAMAMMSMKKRILLTLNPRFEITIEQGDLFKKRGIIVIPVNEYFDTIVDDEIISSSSVHGKWIRNVWGCDILKLDALIEEELKSRKYDLDSHRKRGKNKKYELGECVRIDVPENGNTYVLFALTHFDPDNHAYLKHEDFPKVMDRLMDYLAGIANEKQVYMPLFGTGLSRLNRSPQRILTFMIDAIDFKHSDSSFPNGLFIELYSMNNIDLNQIEELFLNNIHQE